MFFFFKQKTAYEMRISDWSSDVCSSDLAKPHAQEEAAREYAVLPYEEFIRARTLVNAKGKPFGLYLNSRHDRAVNLVSQCLNQMIGLVGPDLAESEEKDLQAISAVDFRTTEPQSVEDGPQESGDGSGVARTEERRVGKEWV